jgi:hypothetical protein
MIAIKSPMSITAKSFTPKSFTPKLVTPKTITPNAYTASVPVLASFQPTNEVEQLALLQDQIDTNQFPNYKAVYSQEVNDKLHDYSIECPSVPIFSIQMPYACDVERVAKMKIMVRIGTRIPLIDETITSEWWGTIRHAVVLVRVNKPDIWQLFSVHWLEGERCPFSYE